VYALGILQNEELRSFGLARKPDPRMTALFEGDGVSRAEEEV